MKYWKISVSWRVGRNCWESGGDFIYEPGDTWLISLNRFLAVRELTGVYLSQVHISLEEA